VRKEGRIGGRSESGLRGKEESGNSSCAHSLDSSMNGGGEGNSQSLRGTTHRKVTIQRKKQGKGGTVGRMKRTVPMDPQKKGYREGERA